MNLRIKRCLFGLMTWAAMTGVVVAQQTEPEGTVQLGQAPPVVNAVPNDTAPSDTEGSVRVGSGAGQTFPAGLAPLGIDPAQPASGNNFGYTPVDRTFRPRFNIDNRGGGLYGYNAGYTNIGMFMPFQIDNEDSLFFVDARALVTYDGGGGGSAGLGWRWWMSDIDRIVGLSAWYDNANGGIGSNFNQIGLSFESLGKYVDYRVNGYIPVGSVNHVGSSTLNTTAGCIQNFIVFQRTTQVAQAFTGFDAEVGGPLPILGRYGVNGYVGGYYFTGAGQNAGNFTGVSGRFLSQINEDVSFGIQVTEDRTFGLNTQFQVFVTLPDGAPGQWMRNQRVQDRLTQSVFRQYRVMTHIDSIKSYEKAIDPATSKPYFVAFIDPNQNAAGNGTDEHPFNTLAQFNNLAAAKKSLYDVIVVNARTDNTSTNLDTGVTLLNGQHLWGAGLTHSFTTPDGTFAFTCGTSTGTPIIANSAVAGGSVVTLANNNEVSGFTIDGSTNVVGGSPNNGIVSHAGGITGTFDINNNTFQNTLAAVQLTHSGSAMGLLTNNIVNGGPLSGVDAGFKSNLGFGVTQTSGTLNLLVQNNTINNVKGEDANGNGVLDPGEDTNGNGSLDMGIGMKFVASGPNAVINAMTDPVTLSPTLGILNNTVTGSGAGIQLISQAGGKFVADVSGNSLSNNTTGSNISPTAGFGFAATATGANSVMTINTYLNNTTSGNEGDGVVFTADAGGLLTVVPTITGPSVGGVASGDTFNNNHGDGLRVQANGGTAILQGITSTTFDSNGHNGLNLVTNGIGKITITDPLASDTFSNNAQNGLIANANSGTINVLVDSATNPSTFSNNGTDPILGGDGMLFQTSVGGTVNTNIVGVTANGNGADGIGFNLNGGTINVAAIQTNIATGNKRDGLSIVNANGGAFNTAAIGGTTAALGNDFSNNTRAGLFFGGTAGGALATNTIDTIRNNNFNRTTSGTEGILFNTTDVLTQGTGGAAVIVKQNSFVGTAATAGRGIGGTINGGGVNFALGSDNPADTNIFTGNTDAHIGLSLSGTSVNHFTIDNENLSNVVNGANSSFNGEGVAFLLSDSATLDGFIRRSTITGNADDGILMNVTGSNGATFAALNNFVIGGSSSLFANTITGNGTNGIQVVRTANGQVNNMQILNNVIQTNTQNGIQLTAANAFQTDTYTINNNIISTNGFDGIQISVQADGNLQANIDNNIINGNGTAGNGFFGSGIHTIERLNTGTDQRAVLGFWTRNTITNNALDGIDLAAASGNLVNNLVIGDPVDTSLANTISNNLRNGVNVEGAGEILIGSNVIDTNGTVGTVGTANETAGIMAQVAPTNNLTIINNQITNTHGDGIQYSIRQGFSGFFSQVAIVNNNIAFNDGRGVNILNRANNEIDVTMTGNIVNANLLEGVYVVNTASQVQNQWQSSTLALDQSGSVFSRPIIEMQFSQNQILANGFSTTTQPGGAPNATGLVVRVGTSDGGFGSTFAGGFASNGASVAIDGSPIGNTSGLGGVTMTVDNSTFSGNFGNDIIFQSFVSTGNPNTGTAWVADPANPKFDPTGYQSDPLARLDLSFRNNTFDSQDVNNNSGVTASNANTSNVAYYNNADGVFKSRLNNIAAPDQPGPFNSATRRRNAQREAARIPSFNAPASLIGSTFLYPGMGASTFRVSTDSDPIFNLDTTPYTTTGNAGGNSLQPFIGNNGELGYGWGSF